MTRRQPLVRRTWRGDYRASEQSEGECEVSDNGEVSDVKMVKRVKESDRQENEEGKESEVKTVK